MKIKTTAINRLLTVWILEAVYESRNTASLLIFSPLSAIPEQMEASILKKFLWRSAACKGGSNSHAASFYTDGISRLRGDAFEGRSIMTPPAVKGKITPARRYQELQDIWTNCTKTCSQFVGSLSCKPLLESKGLG